MLKERKHRIWISAVVAVVSAGLYFLLATMPIFAPSSTQLAVAALMLFAILDFFLVLVMDESSKSSRTAEKVKNIVYKVITILEIVVGFLTVVLAITDFVDPKDRFDLSTLMFAVGIVGAVAIQCTAKIAVYHHLNWGNLPEEMFPFVNIGCTLVGYVVGVIVGLLGLAATFLYGIANLVLFGVLVFFFFKLGYFDPEVKVDINLPQRKSSKPKAPKTPAKKPSSGKDTVRKVLSTFEKKVPTGTAKRNSRAYSIIDRKLRDYLPKLNQHFNGTAPLTGIDVKVDYVWDRVGYNIMLRFQIYYNSTASTMKGISSDEWIKQINASINSFTNMYIPKIKLNVGYVYDMVDTVLKSEDPRYTATWSIDADVAEELVVD